MHGLRLMLAQAGSGMSACASTLGPTWSQHWGKG